MDLSIIIPAYNMEKYIGSCLESVLCCPDECVKMECIVVNDGSKDNTAGVVEEYIKKDNRVKLINKENGGVSDTRNAGISKACGKYIMFLDADDTLVENAWESIENVINNRCEDFIAFSYITKYENGNLASEILPVSADVVTDEKEARELMYANSVFNMCWGKLYKREIILEKKMSFRKGLPIGEDYLFVAEYFGYCKSFYMTKTMILYYLQRTGSAIRSYTIKQRLDFARILYDYNLEKVKRYNDDDLMRKMNTYYLKVISGLFLEYANLGRGKRLKGIYRQAFENELYREILDKADINYIYSRLKRFEYRLFKLDNEDILAFYFSLKSIVFWCKVNISIKGRDIPCTVGSKN